MKNLILSLLFLSFSFLAFSQDVPLWMRHPAISPDGKTIAFSYQGDIYTVPMSGGEARPITLHDAYESHPVWNPNSDTLAFASNRYGNDDVFIVSAKGGSPTRLTFYSAPDTPYDFSPDGKQVLFGSTRQDDVKSVLFPSRVLSELYEVSVIGGSTHQVLTTPAELAQYNSEGSLIYFHDRKGYEDEYRKHHTSSVTRDVWSYNVKDSTYNQLTTWNGEDRNPVLLSDEEIYFLSERSDSFNVWSGAVKNGKMDNLRQMTSFENHPIRDLSIAKNGMICFWYNGEIYTQLPPQAPEKVGVQLYTDRRYNEAVVKLINGDVDDFTVSPNGKEIAFIVRGEVFVTSIDYKSTRRITDTPEQERNLNFNSDGTKLLYSGERNESWNIYEASLGRKEDKYFYNATLINEKPVVETDAETFQGSYSPDDKEVAFLESRTTLRVKNLASGEIRTVLPGAYNYSYSDGDQYYTWSPDSKWFLVQFFDNNRWNGQIGLVNASGKEAPKDLSKSGYDNSRPKFGMKGEVVYWSSDKEGYRNHASWGSQSDVFALFLTRDAYYRFTMDEADYAFWKENQEDKEKEKEKKEEADRDKKKDEDKKEPVKPLEIEWEGLQDRKKQLTIFSSFLSDFVLDEEGENLYYLTSTGDKSDLWKTNFKEKETKIFVTLNADGSNIVLGEEEKFIYLSKDGGLLKIKLEDASQEAIAFSAEMNLNADAERAYMFDHAWRQFKDKFYLADLHNVDWQMYKENYERFLPYINNQFDFADMLSEMLGEINASHTGARTRHSEPTDDKTASLGVFYDQNYKGKGMRIAEVMDKSPLLTEKAEVKSGTIIDKINGQEINSNEIFYQLMNRKEGDKILIRYLDPKTGKHWDDVVEPISLGDENQLTYERWVKTREAETTRLSDGKIGYVHVRGMNSESFREVYSKALGEYNTRDALIVDTRFNGGGWLHDDLATFLSGEPYMQFVPRGQDNMGGEPLAKWQKPSAVLMSESNYSDAHMFPYTYKYFNIGKLIGMPVPGTGTAVWWETMLDGTVFGIPQIGMRDVRTGELLENQELQPDIEVRNDPGQASKGVDQQLEAGVEELLKETKK
ncbi:peptidase S41 [Cryomorpha ignava]|uniref:Tricorn protease homolog n=1 Tax=Cryomorpha ignava TaxID=101383 RepID=A0A7K3WLT9_9FLAO|nr:S41 family peptidase [Cryomorpha ignava]NEN22613.1 peptidase S41 [Cryomorpha ignava]